MTKLTLSVDQGVVERAKRYAARSGTSVSRLVERYLDLVARPAQPDVDPSPVLKRLRSELKRASVDVGDYRRYLDRKYR
jgi:hypothetical protein